MESDVQFNIIIIRSATIQSCSYCTYGILIMIIEYILGSHKWGRVHVLSSGYAAQIHNRGPSSGDWGAIIDHRSQIIDYRL